MQNTVFLICISILKTNKQKKTISSFIENNNKLLEFIQCFSKGTNKNKKKEKKKGEVYETGKVKVNSNSNTESTITRG